MIWRLIAWVLVRPWVARALWRAAQRRPYEHIPGYMNRWWLFNPYFTAGHVRWLPSIRLHHILRKDVDRHLHDHPWNARTFILDNYYIEENELGHMFARRTGDTAALKFGQFHRIAFVHPDGAWTLFVTWKFRGAWGFNVDGHKVPHTEYLA